jgi:hypothetical protein
MANITSARDTETRGDIRYYKNLPLYAGACYAGGVAGISSAGNVGPVSSTYSKVIGVFADSVDNTGGSAGDKTVDVMYHAEFFFNNDGTNALTKAHLCGLLSAVEWSDDNTAANASDTGTEAGGILTEIVAADSTHGLSAGVWIRFD